MKFPLKRKDPFAAAHRVTPEERREWIPRLVFALCNVHRQTGNAAFATKMGFPLAKSGVPGLLEWCKASYENYSWTQRLLSIMMMEHNKDKAPRERHVLTSYAVVSLVHAPPALFIPWSKKPINFNPDKNCLVPPRLLDASWLDFEE